MMIVMTAPRDRAYGFCAVAFINHAPDYYIQRAVS
jgi:hypothetical protein